jgi:WD40 repeat protein
MPRGRYLSRRTKIRHVHLWIDGQRALKSLHSASAVEDGRPRLHDAFGRILLRMRFARSTDVETARCLRALEGHTHFVWSVAWSVDQSRALSGDSGNTVRVWDVETGRCLRTLKILSFRHASMRSPCFLRPEVLLLALCCQESATTAPRRAGLRSRPLTE